MNKVVVGSGIALCLAASASADFLGWAANSDAVNEGGVDYARIDVYAMFSSSSDILLNVFSTNITLSGAGSFWQSDVTGTSPNGGAWNGTFPSFSHPLSDSFVSIGQAAGFGNTTTLDPSFTNGIGPGASSAPSAGGGWYNGNPSLFTATAGAVVTNQNNTGSNLGVFVGRFSKVGITDGGASLNFAGSAGFNTGQNGSDSESFTYVPAPGALALLGLAGLAGRRRRA